jgi:hypothetical protein
MATVVSMSDKLPPAAAASIADAAAFSSGNSPMALSAEGVPRGLIQPRGRSPVAASSAAVVRSISARTASGASCAGMTSFANQKALVAYAEQNDLAYEYEYTPAFAKWQRWG